MADLTPEEKRRIYLEEKARIEAQEQILAERSRAQVQAEQVERAARTHGGGYDWLDAPPSQPLGSQPSMAKVFGAILLISTLIVFGCIIAFNAFVGVDAAPTTVSASSPAQTLQQDYDTVQLGVSRADVTSLVGRDPDLTYTGSNGGSVLQWKDSSVNVFRVMLTGDQVVRATYVPAAGGLDASEIKGTTP